MDSMDQDLSPMGPWASNFLNIWSSEKDPLKVTFSAVGRFKMFQVGS